MASPFVSVWYLYIPVLGILTCYNAGDGSVAFKERMPLRSIAASLWGDAEHVFMMDENGTAIVLASGPEMEIVAENEIDDLFWSTPAAAGDSLLLRGVKKLYCIRQEN